MGVVTGQPPEPVLEGRKPGDPRLVSFNQKRLWYLEQLTPGTAVYNVPYIMRLTGPLNPNALREAMEAVIARHESLRTVFLAPGGNPVPVLLSKWRLEFHCLDFRSPTATEALAIHETEVQVKVKAEAARGFNLARDLLFRAMLIRVGENDWGFFHNSHHIAVDGGSYDVLHKEASLFYASIVSGSRISLPEPPIQYSDFALWQTRYLSGSRLDQLSAYWRNQLAGAPPMHLPCDQARPAVLSGRGRRYFFSPSKEGIRRIGELSKASGTTPFRAATAAFAVLLGCYAGADDVSIGTPVAPQARAGMESAIGFFVNTLVLRINLSGQPTFRELMRRAHQVVQGAIEHSDLTLDKLVEAVRPPRDAGRMPLFQVNFRWLRGPIASLHLKDIVSTPPRAVDSGTAKFELSIEIDAGTGEGCFIEYSTDLFEEETVAQFAADMETVRHALVAEPDVPLEKITAVQEVRERIGRRRVGHCT